jgi:hypothetical protein
MLEAHPLLFEEGALFRSMASRLRFDSRRRYNANQRNNGNDPRVTFLAVVDNRAHGPLTQMPLLSNFTG